MKNQTTAAQTTGRENAIQLLEAQLERGTKPAKLTRHWIPTANGRKRIQALEHPAKKVGEYIPLTEDEKARIRKTIQTLKRKITEKSTQKMVKIARKGVNKMIKTL